MGFLVVVLRRGRLLGGAGSWGIVARRLVVMLVVAVGGHDGWKVAGQPHAVVGNRGNKAEQAAEEGSGWLLLGVSSGGGLTGKWRCKC